MGLLTTLITKHEREKQDQFDKSMAVYKELAAIPNLKPEAQQAVMSGIVGLVGPKLDIPKKHHGMFAQLLAGMHGHLSKGGQGEGGGEQDSQDKTKEGGLQGGIPGINMKALQYGPAVESKVSLPPEAGGGKLPGAEAYSPFYTDDQLRTKTRQDTAADSQAAFDQSQKQAEAQSSKRAAALKELHEGGVINDDQYAQGMLQAQGVKAASTQAKAPKLLDIPLKDEKGNAVNTPVKLKDGTYYDMNDKPIDPSRVVANKIPTNNGDLRGQIGQLEAAKRRLDDPETPKWQRDADQWYVDQFTARTQSIKLGNSGKVLGNIQKGLSIEVDRSNLGESSGAVSGGGGGGGGGASSRSVTVAGPAGTTTQAATPSAVKKGTPARPFTPSTNTTSEIAGNSPSKIVIAQSFSNEKTMADINFAKDVVLGNIPGAGRDKFSKARVTRGMEALRTMTGLTPEQLSGSLKLRKGVGDALFKNSERYAAFTRLDNELNNMGKLLQDARSRVPDYNTFINKAAKHIQQGFLGDKETAALVIAANGYSRVYTTLVGGGWTSNALPHVSNEHQANEAIAASMTSGQLEGVVEQVHRESVGIRKSLVDTSQNLIGQLSAPIGQEVSVMNTEAAGSRAGSQPTSPEYKVQTSKSNAKMKQRSSDGGKTYSEYSTDGGATWQRKP